MHAQAIHDGDRTAFYRATLHALRYCDAREPQSRRFGAEADARWASFAGEMGASERMDLLVRDADAQWPRAFAPRVVFELAGLAEDEPFGPSWEGLEPALGDTLWRTISGGPPAPGLHELLAAVAGAWEQPLEAITVPPLTPTSRVIVAGASAIAATIVAFSAGRDLAWSDQAVVVAAQPAARHLAALASALLGANHPTQLLRPGEPSAGPFKGALLITSQDADADALAWARKLRAGEVE